MKVNCLFDAMINIETLKRHPKNNNKHTKDQIKRLAKILEYQGWRYPIKVSRQSEFITSGHARLDAALLNGWTEVPVNFQDYENETMEYADVTSDNAIASWADLDLSMVNVEVPNLGPDFDIDLLGIKDFKIDCAEKDAIEDEVPEVKESIVKLGDLIELGNHRLLCGDCTVKENVEYLMDGEKAKISFYSPPYNKGKAGFEKRSKYINNQDNDNNYLELLKNSSNMALDNSEYLFLNIQHLSGNKIELIDYLNFYKQYYVDTFVCIKSTLPAMEKNILNSDFEYVYVFKKQECPTRHINLGKEFKGKISNVVEMKRNCKNEFAYLHNAGYDVSFPEYFFNVLGLNGSVIDLFCGTGSTLIACEKTNRKCYAMELDEHYCHVIIERWCKYTGQNKVKINGQEVEIKI